MSVRISWLFIKFLIGKFSKFSTNNFRNNFSLNTKIISHYTHIALNCFSLPRQIADKKFKRCRNSFVLENKSRKIFNRTYYLAIAKKVVILIRQADCNEWSLNGQKQCMFMSLKSCRSISTRNVQHWHRVTWPMTARTLAEETHPHES